MNARSLAPILTLAFLAACSSDSEPQRLPPGSQAATATPPPDASKPPPGVPLAFAPQPGWTAEAPTSPARKAQYRLTKADGDSEDASVVVTYFGPTGAGSTEGNLQRWALQFEQPDGRPSSEVMSHSTRSVNGMSVLDVDVAGIYLGSGQAGDTQRKPNWRMLMSAVETDHGPYFVKLLGPDATVAKWESSFRSFVSSLRQ